MTLILSLGRRIAFYPARAIAAALSVAAFGGVWACSATSVPAGTAARPALRSTIASASGQDRRFAATTAALRQLVLPNALPERPIRDLFVSNGANAVAVLANLTYKYRRQITNGISGSDGLWVDPQGNLYVANFTAHNVTQYKRASGGPPVCTYSTGLHDPIDVTTDSAGNVYVVDFNFLRAHGYIDEYSQCSNTISTRYSTDSGPEGVAVDPQGHIFVSYYSGSIGAFEEFTRGLPTPRHLAAIVDAPGGLALDRAGNLIADDQAGTIDIIPPPYVNPTTFAAGLNDPFHDALNKTQTLLFNANSGSGTVTVYSYPSGTLLTTLGSNNGITAAAGVADAQ